MAEYTIDKIEYGDNVYKLQDNVSGYVSGGNVIPYLTCGTAAGTAAKTTTLVTGTLPTTLTTGTRVAVKFTNSNTVANPTIAIGSYGAIAIKRYGTTAPSTSAVTSWNAGNVITLVYDGTYWMMADWTTTNSTYSEISETNITSGSGTSTGLVSGRRAKAAVQAFESVTDVQVNSTSILGSRIANLLNFTAPTSSAAGSAGLVPPPVINETKSILISDGNWYNLGTQRGTDSFKLIGTKAGDTYLKELVSLDLATTSYPGIMSASDKTKLNNLNDEKVSTAAVTSGTTYYPTLGSDTTSAATKFYDKTGISYVGTTGSSVNGIATLTLGNNATGGSGKYGKLTIYSASQYGATFQTGSAFTADRTFSLPDKNGTIALTRDLDSYLNKPTYVDSGMFGWKLTYAGTDTPTWDPPETYMIGISDDSDNPGSYTLTNQPDDIRNAWSSTTFVLDLNTYNSSTDMFDAYRLVNYYIENIQADNDYVYQVIWFSGIKNYWDGVQIKTKRILCGIYLDSEEQYHTDGEVTVTINEIASAGTDGSEGMTIDGWKICWGSISVATTSASGSGTYTAPYYADSSTISLNYSGLPYVWCQVMGGWTGTRYATPYDITETGFKIRLYASHKNSTATSIRWLAIGKA